MEFLLLLCLFVSQIFVYIVFKIRKKWLNPWVSLGYTVLNVLMAVPFGLFVLIMGVMGTDSGTDAAVRASMIFMMVSALIYVTIFTVSLIYTIKSFQAHKKKTTD